MIKVKVNNEYKDVVKIFCGGTLQKEIVKVWSREAQEYVYESSVEYTGSLPITITANGDALLDYRIYGADGGVGEATENLVDFEAWLVREGVPYTKDGHNYTITSSLNKLYSNPYYFSGTDIYVSISGVMTIPIGSNIRIYIIKRDGTISGSVALGGNSNIRLTQNVLGAGIKFDYARIGPCTVDNLMLNLGRTALPYEPYGYKLPMTVQSENLLDRKNSVEGKFLSAANEAWHQSNFAYTDFLKINASVSYILTDYDDTLGGSAATCFYDANFDFLYGIPYESRYSITFTPETNVAYIRCSYKIPDSISLYGKQTIPVYIGENQLTEGEYVSYAEQKIYRKNAANYFDGYFELGAINYNTGAELPSNSSIRTDFIELEPSNRYYIKWATGSLYMLLVSYDESKNYVRYLGAKSTNPSYFDLNENEKYIRFYLYNTITPPKEMMICKNAGASYYDPQDPPIPLPEIPTIDETTVIDYNGTPKPSQMYVKYRR